MQSDHKEIYKKTSERTGEEEQIYKDIGNTVFAHLNGTLRRPPSLIIKLRGVGSWYLRKKRMTIIVESFPPDFNKDTQFLSEYGVLKHEDKMELYKLFKERLKEYEKYIEIRDSIRKIRHETQVLLTPTRGQD